MTQHSLRNQPAPCRKASDVWVRRTVRCFVQQAASSADTTLSMGRVMTAYGVGTSTSLRSRILGIKAWNITKAGGNSNLIQISTDSGLTTSGAIMRAQDVGSANHLPGVGINIPDLLASLITANSSSSTPVCYISGYPDGVTLTDAQMYCVDVNFAIQPV